MRTPLSTRFQIETTADAERYRNDLIEKLGWANPVTKALLSCEIDEPCNLSICPVCTHSFRVENVPLLASLFPQPLEELSFVTMYVQLVHAGDLSRVDAKTLVASLRKTIARSDVTGFGLIVGAIEPEWRETETSWLIHLHAISAYVAKDVWADIRAALRKRIKRDGPNGGNATPRRRALVIDPVTDLRRQLSYCVKFLTYDCLPRGENGAKGRAVPLKGKPLEELVAWRALYAPDNFLFLYGAKRLNDRFVRLARTT